MPTLGSSTFLQQNTTAATALVTGSITVANGDVIVVKLGTWSTTTAMGAPATSGQTYTSRVINAPGAFNEWCGIYTAVITGSPGTITVSSTPAASARYSMTVERWTSAQLAASPVTNSLAGSGAAASTITPAQATSVISWCSGDAGSIDPATRTYLASGSDEGVRDGHTGANGVEYYGWQNAVSTSSQSYGLSLPAGQTFVIAGIEIQAAAGGAAPAFPAPRQARRRPQMPPRRPTAVTPVRAQINPPFPFAQIKQPRRLRGLLPRRARAFASVPAQVIVVAPNVVAVFTRAKALRGLLRRRPVTVTPPIDQQRVPPAVSRPRPKLPRLFRPRAIVAPQQQSIAPVAPPYPLQSVRTRLRGLRAAHPRAVAPIPGQVVAPSNPLYPSQPIRARIRGLLARRPRAVTPAPAQITPPATPAYAPLTVRARLRFGRLFRGRQVTPVPIQPTPPPTPHLRPHQVPPRRGHSFMPVPPQVPPPVPPAYPVKPSRPRVKGLRLLRGRSAMPVPPQEIQPPVPPIPPTPVTSTGSWWSLVSVLREERAEARLTEPKTCPNDGEPLRLSADGFWYCAFDNYVLGDRPVQRHVGGQDWGGLGGVINTVIADATADRGRRTLSCPHDGEPLSVSKDGVAYCRYDGYRPDGGTMPLDPGQ